MYKMYMTAPRLNEVCIYEGKIYCACFCVKEQVCIGVSPSIQHLSPGLQFTRRSSNGLTCPFSWGPSVECNGPSVVVHIVGPTMLIHMSLIVCTFIDEKYMYIKRVKKVLPHLIWCIHMLQIIVIVCIQVLGRGIETLRSTCTTLKLNLTLHIAKPGLIISRFISQEKVKMGINLYLHQCEYLYPGKRKPSLVKGKA